MQVRAFERNILLTLFGSRTKKVKSVLDIPLHSVASVAPTSSVRLRFSHGTQAV